MIKSKNDKNTFAFVQFSSSEEARVSLLAAFLCNEHTRPTFLPACTCARRRGESVIEFSDTLVALSGRSNRVQKRSSSWAEVE